LPLVGSFPQLDETMTNIVAAHIHTQDNAERARGVLADLGYSGPQVEVFYVTPPGEHGQFPIGGDRDADPGAERAAKGAVTGGALGAVAGVALGGAAAVAVPLLAPAVMAAVAATGVLGGSIIGALNEAGKGPQDHGGSGTTSAEQDDPSRRTVEQAERRAERARDVPGAGTHPSGLMIAVDVGAGERADAVASALREAGATAVERIEGEWRDGRWVSFDPLRAMDGPRDGTM
jgi:hypothetical protein